MSSDLLLEIGCEDLPARYVRSLSIALAHAVVNGLLTRNIASEHTDPNNNYVKLPIQVFRQGVQAAERDFQRCNDPSTFRGLRIFATPRRIAVILSAVADKQADQIVARVGPQIAAAFKNGEPTPAALGFAKSCGVAIDKLHQENGQLVFRSKRKGLKTIDLIPEIFTETIKQMDELVPKRMRWGAGDETFVRPVRWILALLGSRVVPFTRFGMTSGRKTYGHRFHAPAVLSLKSPADYEAKLREAKVWADVASRRSEIQRQLEAEAVKLGGSARITDELLDEVAALVEWPVVISGRIEERFLQLPPEVIVSTVETNQRYFTVFSGTSAAPGQMRSDAGFLKPVFITVANIESKDVAQIIAGNERVVRPRLADALFFWEQDRKQPLEAYGARLATMTFQKDLGSLADKVARIGGLATMIGSVGGHQADHVARAALLCKNDLVTRVVYEFPELQGLMGGYYALASNEGGDVAQAIAEHYRPTQAGGPIPSSHAGQVVALADKLDTLAGIFRIGQKPTASKDPYGLRRAALGALRICIEGGVDLNLNKALSAAWNLQPAAERADATLEDLRLFVTERMRSYCMERGATVEQFEAVRMTGASTPLDFVRRLDALKTFMTSPAAATLAAADKRARNILRQAGDTNCEVTPRLLQDPAEHALLVALELVEAALEPLRGRHSYLSMLQELSSLKDPVDAFFNSVMVMADNPEVRANRLALLARLDALCRDVADLSCLPG